MNELEKKIAAMVEAEFGKVTSGIKNSLKLHVGLGYAVCAAVAFVAGVIVRGLV